MLACPEIPKVCPFYGWAKAILKISYWKAFLVSLVIAFVGGGSGSSFNFNWNFGGGNSRSAQGNFTQLSEMLPYLIIGILIALIVFLLVLAFRIFLGYPLEVGGRRYFIQSAQENFDLNSLGYAFEKPRYLDNGICSHEELMLNS